MTALDVLIYLQAIQSQGNDLAKMKFTISYICDGYPITEEPNIEQFEVNRAGDNLELVISEFD